MGFFFRRKHVEESESESDSEPESEVDKEGKEEEEISKDARNEVKSEPIEALPPKVAHEKALPSAEETKLERRARLAAERDEAERLEEEEVKRLAAEAAALEELEARELEEWDKRKKAEAEKLAAEHAAVEKAERKSRREAKKVADAEKAVKRAEREKLEALEAKAEARRNAVLKKRDSASAAFFRKQWMGECRAKAGTSNAMLRAREKYEEGQRRIEQELKRASRPLPAEGEEHLDFDFDDVDPKEEVKDANVPSASNTEVPPEEIPVKSKKSRASRQKGQKGGTTDSNDLSSADTSLALEAAPYAAVRALESVASTGVGALYGFTSELTSSFGVGSQAPPSLLSENNPEISPKKKKASGKGTKPHSQSHSSVSEANGQEEGLLATANPLKGFGLVCW